MDLDRLFFKGYNSEVKAHLNKSRSSKVTIVGVGQVGMAIAYSILTQGSASELVLADIVKDKLKGEVLDLKQAGAFLHARVSAAGDNYEGTEGSDICVITAGVRQREGEDRRSLLERNLKVFSSIIPPLVKLSPDTLFLVVSNPCDTLAYITWKLSGLPQSRVIGSGTYLDSSRFRVNIAEKLGVSPQSVHGHILGEHGDSSVAVWSGLNVAGVPLGLTKERIEAEKWLDVHKSVIESAGTIIKLKGYTNWAIGCAVSQMVEFILNDTHRVLPLSTNVKGLYGIESELYLSVPCVLGRNGILEVLNTQLDKDEEAKFKESARQMAELISSIQVAKI
jgi:L-lactate dehydrogenase